MTNKTMMDESFVQCHSSFQLSTIEPDSASTFTLIVTFLAVVMLISNQINIQRIIPITFVLCLDFVSVAEMAIVASFIPQT